MMSIQAMAERLSALLLAALALLASVAALGADLCSDVLKESIFDKAEIDQSHYNRSILYTRIKQLDSRTIKNERDFGAKYADIFSGNFADEKFEALKRSLEVSRFTDVEDQNIGSYRLMTANQGILDSWTQCMSTRGGGLQVWFRPQSTTTIELHVRYVPPLVNMAPQTTKTTAMPDVVGLGEIKDANHCLEHPKTFGAGLCTATIIQSSYKQDGHITIHTELGDWTAYLPPRVDYRLKSGVPYPDKLVTDFAYPLLWWGAYWKPVDKSLHMHPDVIREGWVFDPENTVASTPRTDSGGECGPTTIVARRPYDIYTTQQLKAANTAATVKCQYEIVPRIQRIEEVEAMR